MRRHQTFFVGLIVVGLAIGFGLHSEPWSKVEAAPVAASAERTVHIIGGGVPETDLTVLSAGLAAGKQPGVFLLDSPRPETTLKPFFGRFKPERMIAVGMFPGGINEVERRWGVPPSVVSGIDGDVAAYGRSLGIGAVRVVVCPESPPGQLLQAACLAGSLPAPLFVQ